MAKALERTSDRLAEISSHTLVAPAAILRALHLARDRSRNWVSFFANIAKSLDEDGMSCGSTVPYAAIVQEPMTLETQSECSKLFVF